MATVLTSAEFEALARQYLGQRYGVVLNPGHVKGVPKRWDLISPDGEVVGDAKYYTLVGGERLPPAKFSTIAEHVWLLEKVQARRRFLVFGNDERVPREWLKRYGHLYPLPLRTVSTGAQAAAALSGGEPQWVAAHHPSGDSAGGQPTLLDSARDGTRAYAHWSLGVAEA